MFDTCLIKKFLKMTRSNLVLEIVLISNVIAVYECVWRCVLIGHLPEVILDLKTIFVDLIKFNRSILYIMIIKNLLNLWRFWAISFGENNNFMLIDHFLSF